MQCCSLLTLFLHQNLPRRPASSHPAPAGSSLRHPRDRLGSRHHQDRPRLLRYCLLLASSRRHLPSHLHPAREDRGRSVRFLGPPLLQLRVQRHRPRPRLALPRGGLRGSQLPPRPPGSVPSRMCGQRSDRWALHQIFFYFFFLFVSFCAASKYFSFYLNSCGHQPPHTEAEAG